MWASGIEIKTRFIFIVDIQSKFNERYMMMIIDPYSIEIFLNITNFLLFHKLYKLQ